MTNFFSRIKNFLLIGFLCFFLSSCSTTGVKTADNSPWDTIQFEKQYNTLDIDFIDDNENIIFYGDRRNVPICTFNIKGIHSFDIGSLLSEQGVCVRTGHLCAQPATVFFKSTSFIRVSLSFYNTSNEISIFIKSLKRAIKMLSK